MSLSHRPLPLMPKLLLFVASNNRFAQRGYALVVAIGTIVVLSTLLASYAVVSKFESLTAGSSEYTGAGFYVAEAGLNMRAEQVRAIFDNLEIPSGTWETDLADGELPCQDGTPGTGDYACINYTFQEFITRTGLTFGGSSNIIIPEGDPFQYLSAQEFRYLSSATAYRNNDPDRPQAILGMYFLNRRVPMFQFMAFYDKDLEITPGSAMTLNGPLHANANIFLNDQGGGSEDLNIVDRISVGRYDDGTLGNIYRERKDDGNCNADSVYIEDNDGNLENITCAATPLVVPASLDERIQLGLPKLDVPPVEDFSVGSSNPYWSLADLRIALDINGGPPAIEARTPSDTVDAALSTVLNTTCAASTVARTNSFYNTREGSPIEMLDVDMLELLNCIQANSASFGFQLDDSTQEGLVFYFTVDGPLSDASAATPVGSDDSNNYGIRLKNGATLQSDAVGANAVNGLTVVTDQAAYIQGDYNIPATASDWVPAAVISDSLNILSNNWSDYLVDGDGYNEGADPADLACTGLDHGLCPWEERLATDTTVNSAFLSGTSSTGGSEGGFSTGNYNGGMHNFPRLHEVWTSGPPTDQTLTIAGSFVSLQQPDHVDGLWQQGGSGSFWYYQQPIRNWSFETRFSNPNTLPPMTPQVTYLRQELFVRDFTQ